ncbi:MAG: ABC transporter ATP-binding protein [Treponema sp.]|nr:ABC transporter ATP-binding protein [Treponema sp.]
MMLLETKGLTKSYERRGEQFAAVNNACLTARPDSFVCITGESGSGKSTLLNMLTGLLKQDSGEIWFDGVNLCALEDSQLTGLRNGKIGYIPQGNSLLYNFSVLENVMLPWYLTHKTDTRDTVRDAARELLARTGIAHLEHENPRNLSGGEARRVAISRSLIMGPRILIADEPTADLDPRNSEEVIRLFAEFHSRGVAVIVATHHERQILSCANQHFVMDSGNLEPKKGV